MSRDFARYIREGLQWNRGTDSYWVPTSRDEYPDERLSRLPQVTTLYLSNPECVRLLQRPNFELTQLMFFMNRLKEPGGQAFSQWPCYIGSEPTEQNRTETVGLALSLALALVSNVLPLS